MKQRKLQSLLALLLCAVMLVAFAGCVDPGAVEDEPVVDVTPEETPEVPESDAGWEAVISEENRVSAEAAYQVLGADGEAYGNYTFYAAPLLVDGEPDLTYIVENCTACRTIESAEPQAFELEPGVYAIAVTDNANPENREICTIWVKESDGADMLTIETDWEVSEASATDVVFERQFEDGMESAVIRGYDENREVVWTYETDHYEAAQLNRVDEIGRNGDRFYFVEAGAVVALKLSNGSVLWTNDEFGGTGSYTFGADGTVYLCGYLGPDFMAIDPDGKTLCFIDMFYPEYYWAYGIEYLGDQVAVNMTETPSGEDEKVYVSLADCTYSLSPDAEEVPDTDENAMSEADILATLLAKTGMEPHTYYYDAFAKDGTCGVIAVYQYSSAYLENDNCQVWYCDGTAAEQLFAWENTSGNSFCNVLDVVLYQNAEGVPYVVMNTWQRIAMSYEYCQVFGAAESGEVDTVYEAEGCAVVEGGKLLVTEKTTELVDYAPETTEAEFQIDILDGVVQKTSY